MTCVTTEHLLQIEAQCSTSNFNDISTHSSAGNDFGDFNGAVECSQRGEDTTTQSSSLLFLAVFMEPLSAEAKMLAAPALSLKVN